MSITIASICPWDLRAERPRHISTDKNWKGFFLPGVEKGKAPVTLKIDDFVQMKRDIATDTSVETRIPAEDVAADILGEWTQRGLGMRPGCHPGVMRIEGDRPNDKELRAMMDTQNAYMGEIVLQGDRLSQERPRQINERHRMACRYLGIDRPWLKELKDIETRECPYCTKTIPSAAVICPECKNVVNPAEYAKLKAAEEKALGGAALAGARR